LYIFKHSGKYTDIINSLLKKFHILTFKAFELKCLVIKFIFKLSNGKIDDTSLIYNKSYFKQLKKVEEDSVVKVVKILFKYFHPRTVVDLGCGVGIYLKIFKDLNVKNIVGYDRSKAAQNLFCCDNKCFVLADLRKPICHPTINYYDLCLCMEVAEHIEEKYVHIFLDNVTFFSKTIVFTAADVQQPGLGHVNLKPKSYWLNLFKDECFIFDKKLTLKIRKEMEQQKVIEWIPNNLMILKKQ